MTRVCLDVSLQEKEQKKLLNCSESTSGSVEVIHQTVRQEIIAPSHLIYKQTRELGVSSFSKLLFNSIYLNGKQPNCSSPPPKQVKQIKEHDLLKINFWNINTSSWKSSELSNAVESQNVVNTTIVMLEAEIGIHWWHSISAQNDSKETGGEV
ncbi:uncharacterized protein CIMG_13213 [Coccidioides immitis RS]|uniref:Uncharacterized protein n=1 Tax=Coccidioides immitis (strain RS) TaxID=246410 RepID=A0A0D8JU13_COCIM|nr:uncharacterized protein CIMG_13213 [Coccidioides immitis RS]KJF60777.1 hypothetical protein CIMG_13213 [Coccidioides immitis RS]